MRNTDARFTSIINVTRRTRAAYYDYEIGCDIFLVDVDYVALEDGSPVFLITEAYGEFNVPSENDNFIEYIFGDNVDENKYKRMSEKKHENRNQINNKATI